MESNFREKYIGRVRRYLRDYKEKNKLLEDFEGENAEESTDPMISDAIDAVYDNSIIVPPIRLNISLEDISKNLWFMFGVVAYLLDSVAIESIRNTMPLVDGSINIDDNYKSGPFANHAINLWGKYTEGLQRLKLFTNYQMEWIGTSGRSAYRWWGRGYY